MKKIKATLIIAMVAIQCLIAAPTIAQDAVGTNNNPNRTTEDDHDDDGDKTGLIGLVGLIGLAGLLNQDS